MVISEPIFCPNYFIGDPLPPGCIPGLVVERVSADVSIVQAVAAPVSVAQALSGPVQVATRISRTVRR